MKRYGEVLRIKYVKYLLVATFPARIAYSSIGLSFFFKTIHETQSIPLAGLVIGVNTIASSLTAGLRGTVMDIKGQTFVLRIFVPLYSVIMFSIIFVHSPHMLLISAFVLGATPPPINLSVRPLWRSVVPAEKLRTAYAMDSSSLNAAQVLGPVVATALSLSQYPQSPFVVCSILIFTGGIGLAFSRASRNWVPEVRESGIAGVWRNKAMQVLMLEGCFLGLGWGAFNVAVPAFATLEHVPNRTAWILGAMSICNITGGLVAGLVSNRASAWRAMRATYFFWFLATIPLAITYPGWSMALVCAITGLFGGAIQIFYWEVMEAVRPSGTATSALGWLWSVEGSFVAIGSALGGVISKNLSPRFCLALTSVAVGIGFFVLSLGKERLKAADRIPTQSQVADAISDLPSQNS